MTVQLDWVEQATMQRQAAAERLARIVERERQSYACEQYRRHRTAALKATRKGMGL